jgi:hypothetical protein
LKTVIYLYSMKNNEISSFLNLFFGEEVALEKTSEWEKHYENPVEMADIIGVFIDNNDKYDINMWVSIDEGFTINVNNHNANHIIKYLYERFPY